MLFEKLKKVTIIEEISSLIREKKVVSYSLFSELIKKQKNIDDFELVDFLRLIFTHGLDLISNCNFIQAFIDVDLSSSTASKFKALKEKVVDLDKHSTGGLGDCLSLALIPVLLLVRKSMFKLSGRFLGITGGTVEKLLSIPGFSFSAELKSFFNSGLRVVIIEESNNLLPFEKRLYDLRSLHGFSSSVPLIAMSIMVKKLIIPSGLISINIKVGPNCNVKNLEMALNLASELHKIASRFRRKILILIEENIFPPLKCVGALIELRALMNFYVRPTLYLRKFPFLEKTIAFLGVKDLSFRLKEESLLPFFKFFVQSGAGNWKGFLKLIQELNSKIVCSVISSKTGFFHLKKNDDLGKLFRSLSFSGLFSQKNFDPSAGIEFFKDPGQKVCIGEALFSLYSSYPARTFEFVSSSLAVFHVSQTLRKRCNFFATDGCITSGSEVNKFILKKNF